MAAIQARSKISTNDIRARILRLPREVRESIPDHEEKLDVRVTEADFRAELTIAPSCRAYLGGATELFRRVGLVKESEDGPLGRFATVEWTYEPEAGVANLDLMPEGEWKSVRRRNSGTTSDPAVVVATALVGFTREREQVRSQAIQNAKQLIESKLGAFSPEEIRELLRMFNTDFYNGRTLATRFAPGFTGALANDIAAAADRFNRWLPEIWNAASDEALAKVLDDFWASKEVPGAGRSLPTMIAHVREPERYFPIMAGLAKGYEVLTGRSTRGHTGSVFLEYARRLVELRNEYDIPIQATDLVLWEAFRSSAPTSEGAASDGDGDPRGRSFGGFSAEAFQFLVELAANNTDEWMQPRRGSFKGLVREPMRALVQDLAALFVEPFAPDLEHTPKNPNTLASIRKNAYGSVKNPYWPYYWAALHRKGVKKTQDFQLAIRIEADEVRYGFYTGSASEADRKAFQQRILRFEDQVSRALASINEAQIPFWTSSGSHQGERKTVHTAAELAAFFAETGLTIARRVPAAKAVEQGSKLVDVIADTFRVLYPLYALATLEEPAAALAEHWATVAPNDDEDEDPEDKYDLKKLLEDTLVGKELIEEIKDCLADKGQLVLYGPPGTGKTWLAEHLARYLTRDGGEVRLVQFHPSYGYEDFVEGIRPVLGEQGGPIGYRVEPGIFREWCDHARKSPKKTFVLIIDEINRGNLPRIFGELLYLLERRGPKHAVQLPISRQSFSVPQNLVVIGTMNTADQSIALVDVALRRRFHFVDILPDLDVLGGWLGSNAPTMKSVTKVLEKLNDALREEGIDENLFIGHTHFMRPGLDEVSLARLWKRSVMPVLEEYFYGKRDKIKRFHYEDFVEGELRPPEEPQAALGSTEGAKK